MGWIGPAAEPARSRRAAAGPMGPMAGRLPHSQPAAISPLSPNGLNLLINDAGLLAEDQGCKFYLTSAWDIK